jgi:prepilin-type N-terminal cleavage/methylation domain-containing protein
MRRRRILDARHPPRGFTLIELIFALVLSGMVLSMGIALLAGAQRVWREVLERAEQGEVRRTIATVLLEELGRGVPGEDWAVPGGKVLQLRAFRGEARGCGFVPAEGSILVLRRGERQAEAGRDSILMLERNGQWRAGGLIQVRAGTTPGFVTPEGCTPSPGERLERWDVHLPDAPEPWKTGDVLGIEPFFFRYFERGQYSLEDRAFRYRRGTAGRQPLTAERVSPDSHWDLGDDGLRVELTLLPAVSNQPAARWAWRVVGGRGPFPMIPPSGDLP